MDAPGRLTDDEVVEEGAVGFTQATERERICQFWGGYKYGPGDGTQNPPMIRVGPPDMPHVALVPLDRRRHRTRR